jgi:hypothetical protein
MGCGKGKVWDPVREKCVPIQRFKLLLFQGDKCDDAAHVLNLKKGVADKVAKLIDGNITRSIKVTLRNK